MSRIIIAAFNGALPSALLGMADMFSLGGLDFVKSNDGQEDSGMSFCPELLVASSDGKPVTDGHGRSIEVDSDFDSIGSCDAVMIPGFVPNRQGHPPQNITDPETRQWLLRQHDQGALLCGSCSGVFPLGEAGLLDYRQCTTTWWLHDELKKRFPKAEAVWASEMIESDRIISAGGPVSWTNLTLHVVRELAGPEIAKVVADFSVVDSIPKSQDLFVPNGHLSSIDPFLAEVEYIIRKAHFRHVSVVQLAEQMAVSQRTLNRKLRDRTGETPKSFIDRTRISHACTLLQTSDKSIGEIAAALGYSDDTVFRRQFRKRMKITPSGYRLQFQSKKDAF